MLEIPSTLFFIEPLRVPDTNVNVAYSPYGGGVGMSQAGEFALAERGLPYELILRHYYTGIALAHWY